MRLQTFWRALRDIKSRSRDKVPKTGRLPQNLSGMRNTLTAHPTCHQGTEQELTLQKKSMRPAAVSSSFASPSACVGAWRTGARFWFTSFWQTVLQHTQRFHVTFPSCMFGGQRPKKTTIVMAEMGSLVHAQLPEDRKNIPRGKRFMRG